MTLVATLHEAIAAVCPIGSVSIGEDTDKKTWRIDFAPEATQEQRAAAEAVVDGFDPAAPVPPVASLDERVAAIEMALAEATAATAALLAKGVLTAAEISAMADKPGN
jgi:hypothetical protein